MPLFEPDSAAIEHSNLLKQYLFDFIAQNGGAITFEEYMRCCLYAPGLGYYSAGSQKLGRAGDFITAPDISPFFAQCIAKACAPILSQVNQAKVLELGAGTGVLCADLLRFWDQQHTMPEQYCILEVSADLRDRQQHYLSQTVPEYINRVVWLDALPDHFTGVILANEVMDALPVTRFRINYRGVEEQYVAVENDHFIFQYYPATAAVAEYIKTLSLQPLYLSEMNRQVQGWVKSLAQSLEQGLLLLIDYGFPKHEYYHPDGCNGTLMCHYRHQAHGDVFFYPGLQDITAHVDFTAVAEAAAAAGLSVSGYTQQASFLLNCGILDVLSQQTTGYVQHAQAVKRLISPTEMGELFKVMALTRNWDVDLLGFSLLDARHRL